MQRRKSASIRDPEWPAQLFETFDAVGIGQLPLLGEVEIGGYPIWRLKLKISSTACVCLRCAESWRPGFVFLKCSS